MASICQSGTTAALGGSFGGGATSAVWSGGAGTFTNNAGPTPATATYTAGAEKMRISGAGNLLIGTTASPTAVNGNIISNISLNN